LPLKIKIISLPAATNMPATIVTTGHEKEERQDSSQYPQSDHCENSKRDISLI